MIYLGSFQKGGPREGVVGHRDDESVYMDVSVTPGDEVRTEVLPVRVFILNDHELVRQGLRDLLESEGFKIVGEGGSAEEGRDLISALQPDVAVLDDRLPDGTGIGLCRDLRSTAPEVKCLILTGWDEQHAVRAAVLAGAAGYVLKQIGNNELANAIRSAAAGHSLIPPGVRKRVADGLYASAAAPWLETMTPRERSVFAFMARGLTDRQIGQEMFLPGQKVEDCVSSVLEKLGFRRRNRPIPTAIHTVEEPMP